MNRRFLPPLLCALACGAPGPGPGAPPGAALLTLESLRGAFEAAPQAALGAGLSPVFAGGFPPAYFLASKDEIRVAPAYTEGQPSAYISTDIWVNFRAVWAQPLYVFVSDFDATNPMATALGLPWIVSVGASSAFYSPFFRVFYVKVPPGTAPDRYRTVRDVLDAGLPLQAGGTRLLTLLPDAAMGPEDPTRLLLPPLRAAGKVGLPVKRAVYIDRRAQPATALDFGPDRFEMNTAFEIIDQPLFFFFGRDSEGRPMPLTALPRVGGTGPIFAGHPPRAPQNRPIYGSFWRLWAAQLPDGARLFVPRARKEEWEARVGSAPWAGGLAVVEAPAAVDAGAAVPELDRHAFKVVLDPTCINQASKPEDLAACPWLDSQAALEKHIPAGLTPSEILVTCPYVAHAGQAVPPAP